jgi:Amt family ammonium transporter
MLGSLLLWFGWFGFNAGSAVRTDAPLPLQLISNAVVNSTLAGSTAGLVALFTHLFIQERLTGEPVFKLSCAMNGCLCGLASVTGCCGLIEPWAAIIIGTVAGLLFLLTAHLLTKHCIDDAVDAIPVHLSGGLWGVIATGLFATPKELALWLGVDSVSFSGAIYNDGTLLGSQIVGALFIIGWTTGIMLPFFILLNYLGLFRSDSLEEAVGLDVSFHGYNPSNYATTELGNGLDATQKRPGKYNVYDLNPRDDESIDRDGVDRFE